MEGNTLAQGEAQGAVVSPLPGGGQLADELVGRGIAVEQRLEDVAQDRVAIQAVGVPVLERGRLGRQRDHDLAGRLRRLGEGRLGCRTQRHPDRRR